MSMKNSNETIGNQTCNLPTCSAVPQPNALPCAPCHSTTAMFMIWYDMIWYDMIWYDMIWYDMIWYDMIWYCYRHFRFKSWHGPAIQVQTLNGLMEINSSTVNDLTREHSRKCEGRKGIQKREPGQNIHQLSSCLEFYSSGFCSEIRDFCHFEDNSFSRSACEGPPECLLT